MVGCLWFRGEWFQGFKKRHKTRKSRVCMLQIQAWMSTCTIDFYKQSSITDRRLVESKCHVVSGLKPRQLSSRHTLEWPCVDSAMLQEFTRIRAHAPTAASALNCLIIEGGGAACVNVSPHMHIFHLGRRHSACLLTDLGRSNDTYPNLRVSSHRFASSLVFQRHTAFARYLFMAVLPAADGPHPDA